MPPYNFVCAILGQKGTFPVKIERDESVGYLKDAIKAMKDPELASFAANSLVLYQVDIDISKPETRATVMLQISQSSINVNEELDPILLISECYQAAPSGKRIHVLVQLPRGKLIDPRVCAAVA